MNLIDSKLNGHIFLELPIILESSNNNDSNNMKVTYASKLYVEKRM